MAYYSYYIYKLIIKLKGEILCTSFLLLFYQISFSQNDIQLANEYLIKGDKKKAVEIFHDLAKDEVNISFIHNNYIETMLDLGMYSEAQNYLKKISKKNPDNIEYKLDIGLVYVRAGELNKADRYFKELIEENRANIQLTKMMADYLISKALGVYATEILLASREYMHNPHLFSLELAMLYRMQGQRDKMMVEYLNYVTQNSGNVQYVKNILQALVIKQDELLSLEKILYNKIQSEPNEEIYADLLIWVTMQQKNFYGSFVQAKAFDKRYRKEGEKCMEVAHVSLDNDDYVTAAKIFRYVIREYFGTPNYLKAQLGLINTRASIIRNTYPVSNDSVRNLILDYKKFIRQYPSDNNSMEVLRSEALLFANYLDQKDTAIQILNNLIGQPRASLYLKSKAKLDLGDIYLTKGESWESSLLYSQVEKAQKESPIGYEAKLKNAKLSYYKGDFKLAQAHLDILKEATTREIANDAMELSMRIKENIAFDSLGLALKQYAAIELLLYQNKVDEALKKIALLKEGKADSTKSFSNHTILDDVYWLEADIHLKRGQFQEAIKLLQKIRDEFGDEILADDAYFLQGDIYERQLKNNEKAMDIFRDFLNRYPGSVYAAEARKRYRVLRGDFTNKDQPQL